MTTVMESYEAHVEEYYSLRPPEFLRRKGRLTATQLNAVLRPATEWVMPSNRKDQAMKTIEVKDRLLPVEVTVVTSEGSHKEEFPTMDAFDEWFDPRVYRFVGSLSDPSVTMINVELLETKEQRMERDKEAAKKATKKASPKAEATTPAPVAETASGAAPVATGAASKEAPAEAPAKAPAKEKATPKAATPKAATPKAAAKSPEKAKEKAPAKASAKTTAKAPPKAATPKAAAKAPAKAATPKAAPAGAPKFVRTAVRANGPGMKNAEFGSLDKFINSLGIFKADAMFFKVRKLLKTEGTATWTIDKKGTFNLVGFVKDKATAAKKEDK